MHDRTGFIRCGDALHEPAPSPLPSPPMGERVTGGRVRGWFMVPMRAQKRKEASHELQRVAQASCLFGVDGLEACPTLQSAARFHGSRVRSPHPNSYAISSRRHRLRFLATAVLAVALVG